MAEFINEALWLEAFGYADWYLRVKDDFTRLAELAEHETDRARRKAIKREAYGMVEAAQAEGRIVLADHGEDLDHERRPIDRVVVHHTKNPAGMTLERLDAMQLLRIYGMYYAHPTDEREGNFTGQPVWSGHFYKGRQVFWGYHWFVRNDGSIEQILEDRYVGWHSGNWNINTRSIGICIDDDLSHTTPSDVVLEAVAGIIRAHYPQITADQLIGHREANPKTVCPGDQFLPVWKAKLQALL